MFTLSAPLPIAGREDEHNGWYTDRHLQDVLAAPGFASAQGFMVADWGQDSATAFGCF